MKKYTENLGDKPDMVVTVNHNLGTKDVIVAIYQGMLGELVTNAKIYARHENYIEISFGRELLAQQLFRVVVTG